MAPKSGKSFKKGSHDAGILYIVSTPIGNLGDITFRAVETLKNVDVIAAEDTRRASILTGKYDITTSRISYHEHNARRRIPDLIKRLQSGRNVALISDAGTPGISDPGFKLIRSCVEEKINVVAIPGPSAILPALVCSGLPTDRFVFEGFLPAKKGRKKRLEQIARELRTVVLYESPHKIKRTLQDLHDYCGNRNLVIARELTKLYEEIMRTTTVEALGLFDKRIPKGEYVLVLEGGGGKIMDIKPAVNSEGKT